MTAGKGKGSRYFCGYADEWKSNWERTGERTKRGCGGGGGGGGVVEVEVVVVVVVRGGGGGRRRGGGKRQ